MDQDAPQQTTNNEHLDLGTRYSLEMFLMGYVGDEEEDDEQSAGEEVLNWFLARLPVSTTLTELNLSYYDYDLAHRDNRRIVQPICECLANLRREHHPLRKLILSCVAGDDAQLYNNALQRLFIAAKQFGIAHLKLDRLNYLPMGLLVDFCHNNRHLNAFCNWRTYALPVMIEKVWFHPLVVILPRWPWTGLFYTISASKI